MLATAQTLFHMRVTTSIGSIARVPFTGCDTSSARVPSSVSSAVGTLRVPSLSFRRSTAQPVQAPVRVADLDVEHREALAAGRVAFGTRERQRHLRADGRREPLAAVEPPGVAVGDGTVCERPTSEPPVVSVIHCPLVHAQRRVPRREPRQRAFDEALVSGVQQRAGRAVGHRERAGVDVGRRVEQVDLGELGDARVTAVRRLVARRDQPVAHGEALGLAPERRHFEFVHAIAPGIPLRERRLVQPIGDLQSIQRAARHGPELIELRLELAQRLGRQRAAQPANRAAGRRGTGCRARAPTA